MPVATSPQLLWQIVRGNHAFLHKSNAGQRTVLSSEPGNLLNSHSYKHSGLTGDKAVHVAPEEDGSLRVSTTRAAQQHTPAAGKHHTVTRKPSRRVNLSMGKAVGVYRPDLKRAAQARASAWARAKRGKSAKAKKEA